MRRDIFADFLNVELGGSGLVTRKASKLKKLIAVSERRTLAPPPLGKTVGHGIVFDKQLRQNLSTLQKESLFS